MFRRRHARIEDVGHQPDVYRNHRLNVIGPTRLPDAMPDSISTPVVSSHGNDTLRLCSCPVVRHDAIEALAFHGSDEPLCVGVTVRREGWCPNDANAGRAQNLLAKQLGGYEVSEEVVIVGWPSSPLWRTPKSIEMFGPRHFGFDFDYVPIEELQQRRKIAGKP